MEACISVGGSSCSPLLCSACHSLHSTTRRTGIWGLGAQSPHMPAWGAGHGLTLSCQPAVPPSDIPSHKPASPRHTRAAYARAHENPSRQGTRLKAEHGLAVHAEELKRLLGQRGGALAALARHVALCPRKLLEPHLQGAPVDGWGGGGVGGLAEGLGGSNGQSSSLETWQQTVGTAQAQRMGLCVVLLYRWQESVPGMCGKSEREGMDCCSAALPGRPSAKALCKEKAGVTLSCTFLSCYRGEHHIQVHSSFPPGTQRLAVLIHHWYPRTPRGICGIRIRIDRQVAPPCCQRIPKPNTNPPKENNSQSACGSFGRHLRRPKQNSRGPATALLWLRRTDQVSTLDSCPSTPYYAA